MYNLNVLIQAVNDYLYAEQQLREFLKTWVPGWWKDKTAKEREGYIEYTERSQSQWNTVSMLCQLINIDFNTLLSMVKSMNRYEKLTRWRKCIHITYLNEANIRRFLAVNDNIENYYESTGRRRMYIVTTQRSSDQQ